MNKKSVCSIILVFLWLCGFSQDTVITYLDKNLLETDKEKAAITRIIIKKDSKYLILDKYMNGKFRNYSECSSIDPWIENGLSRHYKFGLLYSWGQYKDGKLTGKWDYSTLSRKDIIDYSLVEKYLQFEKDLCKDYDEINLDSCKNEACIRLKSELETFIYDNMHFPARIMRDFGNYLINAVVTIDTSGHVKCPVVENNYNIDFTYEVLRLMFQFKSEFKVKNPVKFSIGINFDTNPEFLLAEKPATFQGGDLSAFSEFVQKHLIYPEDAIQNKIEGKVYVAFTVGNNGQIVRTKVLKGINPDLDKEAVRCINSSPAWVPAMQSGNVVKQTFTLPVRFKLP